MNYIDSILNRITMYRVMLYYLIALLLAAGVLGFFHVLSYSPLAIAFSVAVLVISAWITNFIFAKIWHAVPGTASVYITALILALIVTPVAPGDIPGAVFLGILGVWAMASKYLLAINGKHLFNPAALAVALSGLLLAHSASWWVGGNLALLPLVLIGGLLIVRKIQRFDLVASFAAASLITIALTSADPRHAVWTTLIHSSFFFLAFVMLTEPATMPPTRYMRILYGILVGIWFAPALHIGSFYFTPELALLFGNLFVFFVSPNARRMLTLVEHNILANSTHEFVFAPDRPLAFVPGQYLEWTLPEGKGTDSRGNRRYFTIASAPDDQHLRLGVRMTEPLSTFKKGLLALPRGATASVAQLAGDFILPKDRRRKVAFIAGGIGITPFRSMIGSLLGAKEKRDAVLLYSNRTVEDVAYYEFFERARTELGMKTIYALTDDTRTFPSAYNGFIDAALIAREIPDYQERTFYLSGPRSMVLAFKRTLRELGVPARHVKTDYFPGFA
jgi:ferredoxin-NADP reductase/Na+-translocating ferredoxin:NAD+ oxidoreductase RnfD subunit